MSFQTSDTDSFGGRRERYRSPSISPLEGIPRYSRSRSPIRHFYIRDRSPNSRENRSLSPRKYVRSRSPSRYSPMRRSHSPILRDDSRICDGKPFTRVYSPMTYRDDRMDLCDNGNRMPWREERRGRERVRETTERKYDERMNRRDIHHHYQDLTSFDKRGYSPYRMPDEYSDGGEFDNRQDQYVASRNHRPRSFKNWTPQEYRNGNNEFSRKESPNSNPPFPVICKFYNNKGTCQRGDSCKFLHLCKHFIDGDCRYGRVCKRSHCILDTQPRSLLENYGLIPKSYPLHSPVKGDLIDSIKEKLKNGYTEFDLRTFDESPEAGSSLENQSDSKENHPETFGDFIPLETTKNIRSNRRKIQKAKRNFKKTRKSNKSRKIDGSKNEGDDGGLVPNQDMENSEGDMTITFESKNPDQKFRVRQINEEWQISSVRGSWSELTVEDVEVFSKFYQRANEIREKILSLE